MNYWWRLYAHLAPILPDTALLSRVEQQARAAAPPPEKKRPWIKKRDVRRTFLSLYETQDEEELKARSILLREQVRQLAWQECFSERAAFTAMSIRDKLPENYHDGLRFYDGPIRNPRTRSESED